MLLPAGYHEAIVTRASLRRVEAVWSFVATKAGQSLVLPDGRCDIILRRHSDRPDQITPVVTGPATQAYRVTFTKGDQWFGIRLRPEHGAALWQADLCGAQDRVLRGQAAQKQLPTLAGLDGRDWTAEALPRALPQSAQIQADPRVTRAIDLLHATGGRLRVADVAQRVACTSRHLNRLFRRHVGLAAKTYAQLVQFHRALRLIQTKRVPVMSAVFEAGYADHAHMIRSFRSFGGFTPSNVPPDLTLQGFPTG